MVKAAVHAGNIRTYEAGNLLDNSMTACWRTAIEGSGLKSVFIQVNRPELLEICCNFLFNMRTIRNIYRSIDCIIMANHMARILLARMTCFMAAVQACEQFYTAWV